MSELKDVVGREKRRYGRGAEYAGIFLLISINAKAFQGYFDAVGIGLLGGFVALGIIYFILCWIVGYIDERWGIWREENQHSWILVPIFVSLCKNVEEIKKSVVKEEKKE
jgi:hypothetical protein